MSEHENPFEIEDEFMEATDGELLSISKLAMLQLALEAKVDACEEALKQAKSDLRRVQEGQLPEAMLKARQTEFTLDDGRKVKLDRGISISVPKKRLPEICDWLVDQNRPDMISDTATIDFGKSNDNQVKALKAFADDAGLTAVLTRSVNSGSLKSLLKKMQEAGELDKDLEFFGAYDWKKAVIKL